MPVPRLNTPLREAIQKESKRLDLPPAALASVVAVESAGKLSARVDGRDEPLIRFEGHYFDRRLAGRSRKIAREAGLADPRAGVIKNPRTQVARWNMLKRAAAIHHVAAHESCSWGCGQVMGSHWRWLGYPSVDALVTEARDGVGGQVRLMGRFIEKSGLDDPLRRQDFRKFAMGYNGPAYARNAYYRKIAEAFAEYDAVFSRAGWSRRDDVLRQGISGDAVRALQTDLITIGHCLIIDGRFGPATDAAVRQFQSSQGLVTDGIVGARTRKALDAALDRGSGDIGNVSDADAAVERERSVGWAALTLLYAILQRVFARPRLD